MRDSRRARYRWSFRSRSAATEEIKRFGHEQLRLRLPAPGRLTGELPKPLNGKICRMELRERGGLGRILHYPCCANEGRREGGVVALLARSAEFDHAIGFIDAAFALALTLLVTTLVVDDPREAFSGLGALGDAVGGQPSPSRSRLR